MNILILTPTNPLCAKKVFSEISKIVKPDVGLLSLNILALMHEYEQLCSQAENPHTYPATLFVFAKTLATDKKLTKKLCNNKHTIVIGNLDRNTNIKFDHILGYEEEPWELGNDLYLQQAQQNFQEVFDQFNMPTIDWYNKDDIHHMFPTLHHLSVMLNVLGVVHHAIEYKVQSTPTTGD